MSNEIIFVNGKSKCGCEIVFSDGDGEYSDVHTIIPCTGHSMPESALTQRDDMQQAREQLEEAEKQVEELTMWVKRCRNGLFEPQRVNQCGGYIEMTTITSKFTKERLIDWAVVAVAERGRDLKDAPESVEAAANLKLAEIALASLTAEIAQNTHLTRERCQLILTQLVMAGLSDYQFGCYKRLPEGGYPL